MTTKGKDNFIVVCGKQEGERHEKGKGRGNFQGKRGEGNGRGKDRKERDMEEGWGVEDGTRKIGEREFSGEGRGEGRRGAIVSAGQFFSSFFTRLIESTSFFPIIFPSPAPLCPPSPAPLSTLPHQPPCPSLLYFLPCFPLYYTPFPVPLSATLPPLLPSLHFPPFPAPLSALPFLPRVATAEQHG